MTNREPEAMDDRVVRGMRTIGMTMVKQAAEQGWAPPMVAALSDDGKTVDAIEITPNTDVEVTAMEFFAAARRTLQEHINAGATTLLVGVCSEVSGFFNGEGTKKNGVMVLGATRYENFGTVFVRMDDGEIGSVGMEVFSEELSDRSFALFFGELAWPAVN